MELNFNIYAFSRPRTQAELSALLDEALRMGDELLEMIDAMSVKLAENTRKP